MDLQIRCDFTYFCSRYLNLEKRKMRMREAHFRLVKKWFTFCQTPDDFLGELQKVNGEAKFFAEALIHNFNIRGEKIKARLKKIANRQNLNHLLTNDSELANFKACIWFFTQSAIADIGEDAKAATRFANSTQKAVDKFNSTAIRRELILKKNKKSEKTALQLKPIML